MEKCLLMSNNMEALIQLSKIIKIDGANMGPTWALSAPGGPHVDHMNLLSGMAMSTSKE